MGDEKRRLDDSILWRIARLSPLVLMLLALAGGFVAFGELRSKVMLTDTHETRISRLEEAVTQMATMRDDIRDIRNHLIKVK